jgi:hypothetical protein
MRDRPFGVTFLAILGGIAALLAVIHTLQMLRLLPFNLLGELRFWDFSIIGALMWGILAVFYMWLVRMLWNVDPQGWLILVVLSTLNLILAFISLLGQSSWQALAATIFVNGLVLIYCLLPGTRSAFGGNSE